MKRRSLFLAPLALLAAGTAASSPSDRRVFYVDVGDKVTTTQEVELMCYISQQRPHSRLEELRTKLTEAAEHLWLEPSAHAVPYFKGVLMGFGGIADSVVVETVRAGCSDFLIDIAVKFDKDDAEFVYIPIRFACGDRMPS